MSLLSKEETMAIADLMRNSLKIQNEIGFGDMSIPAPDIDLYPDYEQYFDPSVPEIHLGAYGIVKLFNVKSDEEFVSAMNFVRGHEEQHCRSTANVPYAWAINRGVEMVIEYIASKEEPSKKRFKNERDYESYVECELPKKGIYISMRMLQKYIGGIANSVEDGRIERIRSIRFPGFEKMRMIYRGIFWENSKENFKPYEDIEKNTPEKLRLITNEILTLATCQLYSKGFTAAYAGTPLMSEIQPLLPYIAKGVMAGRTRDMAVEVIEISKLLAPYLYEVCKMSDKDAEARRILEEILAKIIKSIVDNMPANTLSENDEDTDDGSINSTFPTSDLVITLDDETYDKLEKNSKKGGSGGIMIRREHPKDEEADDDKEGDGSGAGGGKESGDKSGKKSSSTGEGENSEDGDAKDGGKSSGGSSKEKSKEGKAGGGSSAEDGDENGSSGSSESSSKGPAQDGQSGSSGSEQSDGQDDSSSPAESKNGGKGSGGGKGAFDEQAVRDAMKKAAEEIHEVSKEALDRVNTTNAHTAAHSPKVVPDRAKTITAQSVKDICSHFKEVKRAYKLTQKLPPVLDARGKALLRKNQQYFKSLSKPNISYLDSGSVDPSRIYGLAFGDTEIFRKKGTDKQFDGCAYILIDNSGSMAGAKREEACKAAAVIEEGFKGIMPFKIVAFDERGYIIHEVVKGWEEIQNLNCCWNFCKLGRQGSGNEDGYDIQIATRELLARPERKKMLIVLSDGAPGNTELCKQAIKDARHAGIAVHGIYFEEGSWRDNATFAYMYEKDYVCCEVNEIDQHLVALFAKFAKI